jgi:hypothetical protein
MCWDWNEERVELYLSNRLSPKDNQAFERHLLRCVHCQERIDDEVNVLLGLRRTVRGLLGSEGDLLSQPGVFERAAGDLWHLARI